MGTWLREQFAQSEAEGKAAMQQELLRIHDLPAQSTKRKWKMRVRIFSGSHVIRPKTLSIWNEQTHWIKFIAVSGKKNQLIIELILGDHIPVQALWQFGWEATRRLVLALNIGTMGFWWWRLPEQISRYYEKLEDLDRPQVDLRLERTPSLK